MKNVSLFDEGYAAFFKGESYKARTENTWLNGYAAAERISACGWYNEQGRPNGQLNKAK